jgi:hypothetical protein
VEIQLPGLDAEILVLVVVLENLPKLALEQTVLHILKLAISVVCLHNARNGLLGLGDKVVSLGLEPAMTQTVTQPQKHKLGVLHSVEVGKTLEAVKMATNLGLEPV